MSIFSKGKLAQLEAEEAVEKKHTILIVDDEEANLVAMSSVLHGNYNLLKANGGQEALDMINGMDDPEKISVVISDQRMPCVTGVMLFQELTEIIPKTIRIIVTGFIDVEAIIDSVNKAHIYRFILKPFERAELLRIISRAIAKFEVQQEREEYVKTLEEKVQINQQALQAKKDELNRAYQSLEAINMIDQLTKMNSRAFLREHLETDLEVCTKRHFEWHLTDKETPLTDADMVFFIVSIDALNQYRQVSGSGAADDLLSQIKGILQSVFEETDFLVRWADNELLVVARFINREDMPKLAERVRTCFSAHNFTTNNDEHLSKTCSIGFSCYPFEAQRPQLIDWHQLVEMAKVCLNAAVKTQGNAWVGVSSELECDSDGIFERFSHEPDKVSASGQVLIQSSFKGAINWS